MNYQPEYKNFKKSIIKNKSHVVWTKLVADLDTPVSAMMRIENITDITDESLQTLKASAIDEYIQESLKDASEKFTSEKQEKEDSLSETREQHESLVKEHDSLKAELESVQEKLDVLNA